MKIENVNVLVIKTELRKCKGGKAYLAIEIINIDTAERFIILTKEIDMMKQLKNMTKFNLNIKVEHGKRGLVLVLDKINKELEAI